MIPAEIPEKTLHYVSSTNHNATLVPVASNLYKLHLICCKCKS